MSGNNKPEKELVSVGYVPLVDCAPLIMASALGFDRRYGIRIQLVRQASWATIRDGLGLGALDAALMPYGVVYGTHLGVGCPARAMAVLMGLSRNGQAITLSQRLAESGVRDGSSLASLVRAGARLKLAQSFVTSTHAMWLYYWLAAHGINPLLDVDTMVVPPPRMVSMVQAGQIHGFCAGEPWHALAINQRAGFTVATSQSIWPDHPEKVLGVTAAWVREHPNTARALVAALIDACRWLEEQHEVERVLEHLAAEEVINVRSELIADRLVGRYGNGLGRFWQDEHPLTFFAGGEVTYPWLSDGMWFVTQLKRWGMLPDEVDFRQVAEAVQQQDSYRDAAHMAGVPVPEATMRQSVLLDGVTWNGTDPEGYVQQFAIKA